MTYQISNIINMDLSYTALIRTFNSMPLLIDVIDHLQKQSTPPSAIVIVDSSKEKEQRSGIENLGYPVVRYPENEDFNFSKAINIGVNCIRTDAVLIISSHVLLTNEYMIEKALNITDFNDEKYMGFCLIPWSEREVTWRQTKVDKENFNRNLCASNSCTMLKASWIKLRPFREDVFSAEDQEWTFYYLNQNDAYFYNIVTHDVKYMNVHFNTQKLINEQIALAYFTFNEMLSLKNILFGILKSIYAILRLRKERAQYHFIVAKELFFARFRKPQKKSKYF